MSTQINNFAVNPNPNFFGLSIDSNNMYDNFLKRTPYRGNPASSPLAMADSAIDGGKNSTYTKFACTVGYINTAIQAVSGAIEMGMVFIAGKKMFKSTKNTAEIFTGKAQKFYQASMITLATGYLIGVPAVLGAGISAGQPGMVTTAVLDGVLGCLMFNKKFNNSTNFLGLKDFNYAPSYAGFANKTSNEFNAQNENDIRKMNLGFLLQKDTYLKLFSADEKGAESRKNMSALVKFAAMDVVYAVKNAGVAVGKAVKQTGEWISGKRDKRPDIFTMKPSRDTMSLGAILVMAGSAPKLIFGDNLENKLGAKLEKKYAQKLEKTIFKNVKLASMPIIVADFLIGCGMMFESLGMMNLANAKEDSRKWPVILTTPFRIVGDFMKQRPFMHGMRTAASSSYEYYVTLMNKEENGKLAEH